MVNAQANQNALLNDWTGPYGGVPAFTDYKLQDLKPALEFAIKEKLNEINKIANNTKPATFTNTIVALEKAGKRYSQIYAVFGIYSANMNSPEFEPIETEMTPKFSELNNKYYQNAKLFSRIAKVYNDPATKKLTSEQQRLVWLYYSNFVREGAKAHAKSKARIAQINKELAALFTKFSQNQLADEGNYYLELKTEADFDGLPDELKNAAIADAKDRKLNVMGCIANTRSSIEPFLTFSNRRDLREKAFQQYKSIFNPTSLESKGLAKKVVPGLLDSKKIITSTPGLAEQAGENISFLKGIVYLMFYYNFNFHPRNSLSLHNYIDQDVDYRQLLALWKKAILNETSINFSKDTFVTELFGAVTDDTIEIDDFYRFVIEKVNLTDAANLIKAENVYQRSFYLSLLHMVFLQSMHRSFTGTFSERLIESKNQNNTTNSV